MAVRALGRQRSSRLPTPSPHPSWPTWAPEASFTGGILPVIDVGAWGFEPLRMAETAILRVRHGLLPVMRMQGMIDM
jgi:hypothetical protein